MKIEQQDVSPEMDNSKDSVDSQNLSTTRLSVDIASSDDEIPLAVGAKQRRKTKLVRKKKPMEPIEDVKCGMCKQSLPPNEIILRQHLLRDHLDAVLYQCSECDYSNSYRKWPIALHMAECHGDRESTATVNDHSHLYRTEIIDLKQRCFPNFD